MPIGGGGSDTDFIEAIALDANASSTTGEVVVGDGNLIAMYVAANTGGNTTHVVTLQISPDGSTWFDTNHQITGVGDIHDITCVAANARCSVTTVEGSTSTIDVFILTK
ncbi:MAG: hypothetical protein JKY81_04825 [Colwellia sp.]|nr:hypothetical protein [Colwellia sp.]